MTNPAADISLRTAAMVAGSGLLIMTVVYILTDFIALQTLIVPLDAAETADNILAGEGLFRMAVFGLIIVIILDVLVAWVLYVLLRPVYATVLTFSLIFLVIVLLLLSGYDCLTVSGTDQLHALVMLSVNTFRDGRALGLVFFGLHLALLGYLVLRSDYIPGILGVLLIVAGLRYLIDYSGRFLFPNIQMPPSHKPCGCMI